MEGSNAEKFTLISSSHEFFLVSVMKPMKNFTEGYPLCFRVHIMFQRSTKFCSPFAENNFLSSLVFTNEHMFSIIVLDS